MWPITGPFWVTGRSTPLSLAVRIWVLFSLVLFAVHFVMRPTFLQKTLVYFFLSLGGAPPKRPSASWERRLRPPYSPLPSPLQGVGLGVCSTYFCWVHKLTWSVSMILSLLSLSDLLHLDSSAAERTPLISLQAAPPGELLYLNAVTRHTGLCPRGHWHPMPGSPHLCGPDAVRGFLGPRYLLAPPQLMALGWIVQEKKGHVGRKGKKRWKWEEKRRKINNFLFFNQYCFQDKNSFLAWTAIYFIYAVPSIWSCPFPCL